jgi:hypothetical protein
MAKAEKPKATAAAKAAPSKKTQYGRFVEIARKLGCNEDDEAFERSFGKIIPPKRKP